MEELFAFELGASGAFAELSEEARNPVVLTLGFRLHWFTARRFYFRLAYGPGWVSQFSEGSWTRESLAGMDVGVGYTLPVTETAQVGPYLAVWAGSRATAILSLGVTADFWF